MTDLERHVAQALPRQSAPPGFTEAVLRAARARRARHRAWLAAATLVAALLPGTYMVHRHQQRKHAEAQLRLALEVTSEHLNALFERLGAPSEQP